MSLMSLVLTDLSRGVWVDQTTVQPTDELQLAGSAEWSISKRTLRGGPSEGVEVIDVDNGVLSVSVLPTRGMGLWKGAHRGFELGWKSPVRWPVNPAHVNLAERGGLGWLAGFNELLCRCGLAWQGPPGDDNGTPLTLHGKIANTPAHTVEVQVDRSGPGTLRVIGTVDETSLFGPCLRLTSTLETEAGSNRVRILDRVTNIGGKPQEMQLLYHLNLGRPLLGPGAEFRIAAREMAPSTPRAAEGIDHWSRYEEPVAGYAEQVYFFQPATDATGHGLALLKNAIGDRGLSVRFNQRQLPWFILWKNTQADADGYCTGLEPSTTLPNFKTFEREQGRVIVLPPGESYDMTFEIAAWDTAEGVSNVQREIETVQEGEMVVHPEPKVGWTKVG